MKYMSSAHKVTRTTAQVPEQAASAGPNGIAITPPAYGMDVVDRRPVQAALAHGSDNYLLESTTWPARDAAVQRRVEPPGGAISTSKARQVNSTGLPDHLKAGIETLSGLSMDDVRVHYNSSKPAQVQALAYTQGTDIHVGPGQERHLPHEAWHVVQQKQGRVKPTMQLKGTAINDDMRLEDEADRMGAAALPKAMGLEFATGWERKTDNSRHVKGAIQSTTTASNLIQMNNGKSAKKKRQQQALQSKIDKSWRNLVSYAPNTAKTCSREDMERYVREGGEIRGHSSGKSGSGMNQATRDDIDAFVRWRR